MWEGYVGALVAVLSFGTYAVPVGLSPVGDGVFFQVCVFVHSFVLLAQSFFKVGPMLGDPHGWLHSPACIWRPARF